MTDHVVLPWLVPLVLVAAWRVLGARARRDDDRRLTVGLAAAAFLVGAWQLEGVLLPQWRARAAQAWPAATGTVVHSQVATTTPGRRSTWRRNYYANVGTEFSAGGVADTAWRVGLTRAPGAAGAARAIAARYPVGARVPVYYDPARPWEAVLERDPPPASPLRAGVGLALAGGAVTLLLSGRSRRRARPA